MNSKLKLIMISLRSKLAPEFWQKKVFFVKKEISFPEKELSFQ